MLLLYILTILVSIIVESNQSTNGEFAKSLPEERSRTLSKVRFPESSRRNGFLPEDVCNETFCEHVPSYPFERIREIMKQTIESIGFFGVDEEPAENRSGDYSLCPSIQKVIYPKAAKNNHHEWRYIINQGERQVQGVRVEICVHFGECRIFDTPPHGIRLGCIQKYMYRRLLTLSDNGEVKADTFPIPTACCCESNRLFNV
ncbi:hypothetical protein FQA39_LY09764 [Lamprigera yunnana]|nr:hypothetical protein FQA39_LY09764 [Lamprigera yunnana]